MLTATNTNTTSTRFSAASIVAGMITPAFAASRFDRHTRKDWGYRAATRVCAECPSRLHAETAARSCPRADRSEPDARKTGVGLPLGRKVDRRKGAPRWGAVPGGLVESDDAGHSGPSQSFLSCVSNLSPLRQFPLEHDDFLQGLVWRCPWIFTSHSK